MRKCKGENAECFDHPDYQEMRRRPFAASKCLARLTTGNLCSLASAAIQQSLAGIGVPSFFSCLKANVNQVEGAQAAGAAAVAIQRPALRNSSRRLRVIGRAPCAAIQATNSLSVMPIVSEEPGTGGRVLALEPRFIIGTEVLLEIFDSVFQRRLEVNAMHPRLRDQSTGTAHLVSMRNTVCAVITRDVNRTVEILIHQADHE